MVKITVDMPTADLVNSVVMFVKQTVLELMPSTRFSDEDKMIKYMEDKIREALLLFVPEEAFTAIEIARPADDPKGEFQVNISMKLGEIELSDSAWRHPATVFIKPFRQ